MKHRIFNSSSRIALSYPALFLLLAAMSVTRPFYYADSYEYAHTIMQQEAGKNPYLFLDAGHLLWRPMGMLVQLSLNPTLRLLFPQGEFARVSASLILLVVLFTFVGIIYFYRLLRLFPISEAAVQATMILFVVSACVLNYDQTGTSYIAGLSVVIIGIYFSLRATDARQLVVAGAILGIAPFLWMPYILALPGAVFTRSLVRGVGEQGFKESLIVIAGSVCIAIILLLPVTIYLRLFSFHSFLGWMLRSSLNHQASGISRTFFGLTRILFFEGNTPLLVKRYLFHDPYYPVVLDRLIVKLWKVELFYTLCIIASVTLVKRPTLRRYLLWIGIGMAPNLILSIRWDGAALERYLPLFPFFFIALGLWFQASTLAGRFFFLVVTTLALLVNTHAQWYSRNSAIETDVTREMEELPKNLAQASMVAVIGPHVPLVEFQADHPFNVLNQSAGLPLYPVVQQGFDTARFWRQDFECAARRCWETEGQVWISKALLQATPGEFTYWIENSDPGVSWKGLSNYFQGLHYADSTKDFYLLQKS